MAAFSAGLSPQEGTLAAGRPSAAKAALALAKPRRRLWSPDSDAVVGGGALAAAVEIEPSDVLQQAWNAW